MENSQYIHIGHCIHPHGIRGEFAFVFYNDNSDVIKKNSEILISPSSTSSSLKDELLKVKISNIRYGSKIIVEIEGIKTRNEVESMIPFNIYCKRSDLPILEEDEFYLNDLLGCKAINKITREEVGIVKNFYENGEQVILEISNGKEKFDILFIDHFVPIVDIEKKIIEIIMPEIIE
jgi:16S rRNA processing protein RimM